MLNIVYYWQLYRSMWFVKLVIWSYSWLRDIDCILWHAVY